MQKNIYLENKKKSQDIKSSESTEYSWKTEGLC